MSQPIGRFQVNDPESTGVPENVTIILPDDAGSPLPGSGLNNLSQPGTPSTPAVAVTWFTVF